MAVVASLGILHDHASRPYCGKIKTILAWALFFSSSGVSVFIPLLDSCETSFEKTVMSSRYTITNCNYSNTTITPIGLSSVAGAFIKSVCIPVYLVRQQVTDAVWIFFLSLLRLAAIPDLRPELQKLLRILQIQCTHPSKKWNSFFYWAWSSCNDF